MSPQDFTRWQPGYSVGNWVLDNQHKVILSLCKDAIESVPDGSQGAAARFHIIRNDLVDCIEEHFGTEESLLRRCHFPLLDSHKEEHVDFQCKLTELLMLTALGKVDPPAFHHFLSQWWSEHILDSDKKFAGAIHRRR